MRFNRSFLSIFFSPLLLLNDVLSYTEFEIFVPTHVQKGLYSESMILFCTFPVDSSWDLYSTVITWQRQLEVIHTFYYGRDQLQHQSHHYRNRTSLFLQELKNGNASLRLDNLNLEDEGEYTCFISTQLGSQKKSLKMKVAAFFPEPHLHISLLNEGHVEVLVTSDGGYPSPSLQWLMGNKDDVTNKSHTQIIQDKHTRLYSVNSKLNISSTVNYTFILKNHELGQEIRRSIELFAEHGDLNKNQQLPLIMLGLCLLVFIVLTGIFSVIYCRKRQMKQKQKYLSVDDGSGNKTRPKLDCHVAA